MAMKSIIPERRLKRNTVHSRALGGWVCRAIVSTFLCANVLVGADLGGKRTRGSGAGSASGSGSAPIQPQGQQQGLLSRTLPAQPAPLAGDTYREQLGGSVYSTGTDDVIVNIIRIERMTPVGQVRRRVLSGMQNGIYLLSTNGARFLGLNSETRQINLGKPPPGELIFAIRTPQGNIFRTGPADKNPDKLEHAVVRSYLTAGVEFSGLEVWFEDLFGPTPRSDHDYNDAAISVTGGVTSNGAVADLLKTIAVEKGQARLQGIASLKQMDPLTAAAAGFK